MSVSTDSLAGGASRRSWLKKLGGVLGGGWLLGQSQAATAGPARVAAPQGYEPFLSEIMLVAFDFAPKGWAPCDGRLLPINQNQALFALIGTTYGGDGTTTFALPDLRGRVVAHFGGTLPLGQKGGTEAHVLLATEIPAHTHGIKSAGSNVLGTTSLSGTPGVHHYLADSGPVPQYGTTLNTALANSPDPVVNISSVVGSGQGHENRQPFLALNYIIAVQGIFPSRS